MPFAPLVEPVERLSDDERRRTARHTRLAGLGEIGQRRLAAAHVAVIGAGGLGSPVVLALAAAGVGTITIVDDDTVDETNLQRQVMHRRTDIGKLKTASASRAAQGLSATRVIEVNKQVTHDNGATLLAGADVVIDGTDSFASREAVAAACEQLGVPLVWGTIQEFAAQITVFWSAPPAPAAAVRLHDLYPPGSEAPSCADVGVLGALCGQAGSIMALEAIKLIAGIGEPLLGRLVVIDSLRATQREVPLRAASAQEAPAATPMAAPRREPIPRVTEADLSDAVVIDVREDWEIAATTLIPGARHLPLARLLADPASVIAGDAPAHPLVITCHGEGRAQQAAEALRDAGVEASVLAGGMSGWLAAHATRGAGVR